MSKCAGKNLDKISILIFFVIKVKIIDDIVTK